MARGNFGERLKRERELREVSLDELSKATRISNRFLQALENEDWEKLPGGVFGHGFVRTVARYLGLDENALLGEYDLARTRDLPPSPPQSEERIPSPPNWIPVVALAVALLLAVGLFFSARYGWHRIAAYRAIKRSSSTAGASSVPSQLKTGPAADSSTQAGETPADSPLELTISTSAATRMRILADDKLLLDRELTAGETRRFSAKQRFEVSASDSSAVLLELNGKAMPPLGAPGTFGRMVYRLEDLRKASGGDSQP